MYNSDEPKNDQDLQNQYESSEADSTTDAFAAIGLIMLFVALATVYVVQQGF